MAKVILLDSPMRHTSFGKTYEEIYGVAEARRLRKLRFKGLDKGASTRGRTYEDIHGVEKAAELRKLRSETISRIRGVETLAEKRKRARKFRKSLTEEAREKISQANLGKKKSEETRARMVLARTKRKFGFRGTEPELLTAKFFHRVGMHFSAQFRAKEYKLHSFDFYLKDFKLLVEVDGCYWHGCKIHYPSKQDLRAIARNNFIARKLRRHGWMIVRVWEHEVLVGNFSKIWRAIIRLGDKGKPNG